MLVMKDGSAIKLAPGRSIMITEDAYQDNKNLLEEYSDRLNINKVSPQINDVRIEQATDTPAPPAPPVPSEPIEMSKEEETPVVVTSESNPKPVAPEPVPKARRKRNKSEDTPNNVEGKAKRRRSSKKVGG